MNRKKSLELLSKSKSEILLIPFIEGTFNANHFYFCGKRLPGSIFIQSKREKKLFCSSLSVGWLKETSGMRCETLDSKKLAKILNKKKVSAPFDSIGFSFFRFLKKSGCKLIDCSSELAKTRALKSPEEIRRIKDAEKMTLKAINEISSLKGGEKKLANEFSKIALDNNCETAFCIVASGKNTRFPHSEPSEKRASGPLMIDAGFRFHGYCSDVTRCFSLSAKQEREYDSLKEIHSLISKECVPGAGIAALSILSKTLFSENGLSALPHSIGHGVGLDIHEEPAFFAKKNGQQRFQRLERGMALAIEPAVYKRDYGLRFEREVFV